MSGYVYGGDLAARLERQMSALTAAQHRTAEADQRAATVLAEANTAAHKIITDAINAADNQRTKATADVARIISNAKMRAEQESSRIREHAYLEGRTRADAHRIEHDQRIAGNKRRKQLEHTLRR